MADATRQWCGAATAVALIVAASGAAAGVVLGLVIVRLLNRGRR